VRKAVIGRGSLCETWPVLDDDPGLQRDHPLAHPSRARLFAALTELRRVAKTAELAERVELHPNGARIHLERLEEAGLVARVRLQGARGRPAHARMVAPDARPGGREPRAYRDVARWLARSLNARRMSLRGLEQTGREVGRELAPSGCAPSVEAIEQVLAALGFAPYVQSRDQERMTIRLGNCPYRDAARENQAAICALHKGVTRGLLDILAPDAKLERFVPRDPASAGCTIGLRLRAAR
jgi:predicted ArsR family transcriptional regulator